MSVIKLNQTAVKRLVFQGKSKFYWDTQVKGFGVRVFKTKKTYVIKYREYTNKDKTVLYSIGDTETIIFHLAKSKAKELLQNILLNHEDPRRIQQLDLTLKELISKYIADHVDINLRQNTKKTIMSLFNRYILSEEIANASVQKIDYMYINVYFDKLLHDINRKQYSINLLFRYLRALFNWAKTKHIIRTSPMDGMKQLFKHIDRDRVLNESEIIKIWQILEETNTAWSDVIKLLFLTGQRPLEVAQIRKEEVDFKKGIWIIPAKRAKAHREQIVPLTEQAKQIIQKYKNNSSEFFFITRNQKPLTYSLRIKLLLDNQSKIENWRLHDIRRTIASFMVTLGVNYLIINLILNHSLKNIMGVTSIYNKHQYLQEKLDALTVWQNFLFKTILAQKKQLYIK